ncbi:uroporphyrinogen-III C-methyltransferase, partial [Sphaerotilus montanus]|uniref:uroporphyrinogen-III C-methyltransferase n=1 Tax=Sphaerotilus montanus TaxID=522889 RepID=UPI003FA306CE
MQHQAPLFDHQPNEQVRVVFIGAGPGAADLITLRGLRRLREAEVVLFVALTDPALRVEAPTADWVDVGKRGFSTSSTGQARINALLVEHAQRSSRVVRLKGGDPSVFGRLEEELEALRAAGIGCEVVPGITSALAAAAATRRRLPRRGGGGRGAFSTATTQRGEMQGR